MRKIVSGIMLILLLANALFVILDVPVAVASGTIYIRADGSIDPPTAPIQRYGDTYLLTGDIFSESSGIHIYRDNMTLDGAGHTLLGANAINHYGIYMYQRRNVTARNLTISSFVIGIYVYESANIDITGNTITNGSDGVKLMGSSNTSLNGNNITNNQEGVVLVYSGNVHVTGNTIVNNTSVGVYIHSSPNNIIAGNSVVQNSVLGNWAILLNFSPNNSIIENHFSGYDFGFVIGSSNDSRIFHNNFINNTRFQTSLSENIWDDGYPSGGNYWSDYTDVDLYSGPYQNETGSDGTWDHPYTIDVNNQDHYPFVNPWIPRPVADSFRFPLDGSWTIRQRFGRWNNDWQDYHLGEDVLRNSEVPVYAPANGVVKHNAKRTGYGYVVIIEHELVDGTFVCSVLGHLRQEGRVSVGSNVTKGQVVGYLSSLPEENGGIIHLHYGIRKGKYSEELDFDGKWRYRGYGPIDIVGSWCPPSAFIDYYNLHKETPPSYDLTINVEGGGSALAATGTASVFTLVYKTILSLISSHPWFRRWIGADNDIPNPTTVTMNSPRVVTEVRSSEPPPTPPSPAELAKAVLGKVYRTEFNNFATKGWEGGKFVEPDEVDYLDCSGLIFWSYNKAHSSKKYTWIYDGANAQYWENFMTEISEDDLLPGDALFFDWNDDGYIDHVAMYVGEYQWTGEIQQLKYYTTGDVLRQNAYQPIVATEDMGNPIEYSGTHNVVHASGDAGHSYGVRPDNASRLKMLDGFVGFRRFTGPKVGAEITGNSPIDLIVTDPDGFTITKEINEIPGVLYYSECDIDGDGEPEDIVTAPERKLGNYIITVIPELGASPQDTFTVEVSANDTIVLLADYAQISEVLTDPYIITQNETDIMLRNINIAVNNITPSKNVVGQGYSLSINTTVQNQGNLAETFNVTLYMNTTTVATFTNITLTSGNSTTLTFTWNTTGFASGSYIISAYVEPVLGETDVVDNRFVDGIVKVFLLEGPYYTWYGVEYWIVELIEGKAARIVSNYY